MTEEIPYEDGNKKDILITMTREEYKALAGKEFFCGWLVGLIGFSIGSIVEVML